MTAEPTAHHLVATFDSMHASVTIKLQMGCVGSEVVGLVGVRVCEEGMEVERCL